MKINRRIVLFGFCRCCFFAPANDRKAFKRRFSSSTSSFYLKKKYYKKKKN